MDLLYAAHVPPGDGPFPTILALHGWGASAHDLLGLAPILHRGEALVLSPQGPLAFDIGQGMAGYGWFQIGTDTPPGVRDIEVAADRVRAFLAAALERYPINPRKIVVMGFSQGGVIGYDLVLREPDRFAGLMALSSWLPEDLSASLPAQDGHQNFPALVVHGTQDQMIPVARAQASRALLVKRGIALTYREFEMEHTIAPEALRDIVGWLEDKVISPLVFA
jgi:phospholipase/carboxylesterase